MTEKRAGDDVFQEAYQDFFTKEKTKKEEGVPDVAVPDRDLDQSYPGDLRK
jgi:hypothetical protein